MRCSRCSKMRCSRGVDVIAVDETVVVLLVLLVVLALALVLVLVLVDQTVILLHPSLYL